MLEILGIPLVGNSFYTFGFALFTYIPLALLRTYFEECMMINTFGLIYLRYKSKVNAFLPLNVVSTIKYSPLSS